MAFTPLTSKQVLEFLPLNTWTEVHLIQSGLKNVYVVTTKKNMEKRKKDMESISLESSLFDKVTQFEICKIVAVEIEGKWFRGKLISFNEFVTDNTLIELIDYGSVYETKLENLFVLPYYFMYEPLALSVTFKDFIPKKTTFSIKPLLSESNLYEGAVLVDIKCNDISLENCVNEYQLLESRKDLNSTKDSNIISVKNNMTIGHDINESSLHLCCLENVKLKEMENGSYMKSNYLMKCTSTQTEEFNQKPQNITENETVLINKPELEVISNIKLRTGDTVFSTNENVKLIEMENGSYMKSNYLMKCTSTQTEEFNQKPQNITENETVLINKPELEVISNIKLRTGDTVFSTNGSNGVSNNWRSGDRVEFLFGKYVDNIYVRKIKLYKKFKNVLDRLKGENSEQYKPIAVKTGDFVAVYCTKNNGGIYRARVLMQDSEKTNNVECVLIDFAETFMIPSKNIFALPNYVSLKKIPTIVRRVSLIGVHKNSNIKIIRYLSSLKGNTYVMEYNENPGPWDRKEVVLKEVDSGVSLNDEIQKLF